MTGTLSITTLELFGLLAGAALLSSAVTLLVLHLAFKYRIGPELEHRIDLRLKKSAQLIQEGFRERLGEVLSGKSDVIRERARDLARTGIGLLAGRRAGREEYDDEGDF